MRRKSPLSATDASELDIITRSYGWWDLIAEATHIYEARVILDR